MPLLRIPPFINVFKDPNGLDVGGGLVGGGLVGGGLVGGGLVGGGLVGGASTISFAEQKRMRVIDVRSQIFSKR